MILYFLIGFELGFWVSCGLKYFLFSFFGFQERAALAAASDPYRYVEKRKPIPDPQVILVFLIEMVSGYVKLFFKLSFFFPCNLSCFCFGLLLAGKWFDIWEEEHSQEIG